MRCSTYSYNWSTWEYFSNNCRFHYLLQSGSLECLRHVRWSAQQFHWHESLPGAFGQHQHHHQQQQQQWRRAAWRCHSSLCSWICTATEQQFWHSTSSTNTTSNAIYGNVTTCRDTNAYTNTNTSAGTNTTATASVASASVAATNTECGTGTRRVAAGIANGAYIECCLSIATTAAAATVADGHALTPHLYTHTPGGGCCCYTNVATSYQYTRHTGGQGEAEAGEEGETCHQEAHQGVVCLQDTARGDGGEAEKRL